MLSSSLIARCLSAKTVGIASASKHALEFSNLSSDGSGNATLFENTDEAKRPGVLFEFEMNERDALDKFKGAGHGYDRVDGFYIVTGTETIITTTYLASHRHKALVPFNWYLALVVAGVLEHELGDKHVSLLQNTNFELDANSDRKSRIAAIRALAMHGHDDYDSVIVK